MYMYNLVALSVALACLYSFRLSSSIFTAMFAPGVQTTGTGQSRAAFPLNTFSCSSATSDKCIAKTSY